MPQQQLSRKQSLPRTAKRRLAILRRCFRLFGSKILRLVCFNTPSTSAESGGGVSGGGRVSVFGRKSNSELVDMKISLLGDSDSGKTSFLSRYIGNEKEEGDDHI